VISLLHERAYDFYFKQLSLTLLLAGPSEILGTSHVSDRENMGYESEAEYESETEYESEADEVKYMRHFESVC